MSDPISSPTCPDCAAPLPPESPQALCPACLMRQALASRTIVDGDQPAPASPPLSPEELGEKFPGYEILECLGRGGMGVVYKARQKSLNRIVAIKILAPERGSESRFAERFAREAELLAKLNHPHIVTIHDFGVTDSQPSTPDSQPLYYLVMEFVDGVNLRDLLRDGKLEDKQALAIVPPICEALQYAHDKGIVHRDIKPENLLLDRDGRVKIADFGIASLIGAGGESAGTPPYMAPEQSGGPTDHRADIYALGVVLYEMLTGERPDKELIAPSRKVHIEVRLDEIVLRALEKTPELRYQTAGVFKTQVESIVAEMEDAAVSSAQQAEEASGRTRAHAESKFSRTAIVGACWAFLGFLHFIFPTLGYRMKSELVPMMMMAIGLSAPFGTTILGWVAVRKIRRSAGKIRGIWLAVLDGLFFPLLLLVVVVAFALALLISELEIGSLSMIQANALALLICAPFCFMIVRFTWRKLGPLHTRPLHSQESISGSEAMPAAKTKAIHFGKWALGLFIGLLVAVLGLLLLFVFTFKYLNPRPSSGSNDGVNQTNASRPKPKSRDITQMEQPEFGPTIERQIPRLAAEKACLLDFDTGEFHTPPGDLVEQLKQNDTEKTDLKKSSLKWLRESGVDIAASPDVDTIYVIGSLTMGSHRPFGFDDMTPDLVADMFSKPSSIPEHKPGIYSAILPADLGPMVFITSEGTKGVMEIPSGTNDPAGVKIRYKLLHGSNPSAEAMAAAKAVLDLPPLEAMKELKIPFHDFPDGAGRMGYRLTVAPDKGAYVLATLREFEGTELITEKTPAKRQVARLLRTQSVAHSEDVFLDSYRDDMKTHVAATSSFAVSGFGQQVVISGLDFAGGESSGGGIVAEKPIQVIRRFKFTDPGGDKTRTRIVEFELRVISEDETAVMAKRRGFSLPDENVDNWAITLAEPPDERVIPDTDAVDSIEAINDTNQFLDLELAVIDAKASGLGDNHPSVIVAAEVLERFKQTHPKIPDAVWQQLVGQRLEKAQEELVVFTQNGIGDKHPVMLVQQARIKALTEMAAESEESRRTNDD